MCSFVCTHTWTCAICLCWGTPIQELLCHKCVSVGVHGGHECGGRECALSGHGCGSGVSCLLVCAYTAPRPHPQAHPALCFSPTLTAPQAVPNLSRPTVSSNPQRTHATLSAPAHLHFLLPGTPPSPKSHPGSDPGSRLRSDFIADILKAKLLGWARFLRDPGAPASCRVPGPWRCPVAATWSWWGQGVLTAGVCGATGRGASQGCSPVPARPGWGGAATGSGVGGQARKPCGGEGASGSSPEEGGAPG